MRISEVSQDVGIDKFVVALRNHIGRAASQKAPAKLNWEAIGQMSRANGFEFAADYETFKSMYDAYPIIQELVKNFNSQGIVLNVPGVSDRNQQQSSPKKDSQAEVDKIAASNAEANLGDSVNNSDPVLAEESVDNKAAHTLNFYDMHGEEVERKLDAIANTFNTFNVDVENYHDTSTVPFFMAESELPLLQKLLSKYRKIKIGETAGKLPEAIVSQDDPNRDAIRAHQARQHRLGNKITWQQAKQEIDDKLNPPQPKKQRAPKAPRRPSLGMSSARFQKIMKGASQDFHSDFGDQEYGLEDVAWDLAGSLMHDPEISKYVRGTIARNAGMRPDEVDSNVIQDYIADEIFSAGSANESTAPVDETYFGREIYFIKFTGKPATSIDNIMHNMKKKLVSFEVVDARAATGGEFGNDETEQAFSVDQADGSKIDKWINKTNYVELLDGYEKHGAALLDHTQKIAEISNDLRQRYKEKSAQVIKNVEPYTKKGEYKDLAKRLVARRKAGLDKVNVTDEAIGDAGRSHQAIYQVVCRGNFYAGKYYETGLDSIFVLADSPEEATQIAKNNVDAIVDHFHNKRYKVGSRSIPAIRKNDTQVAVSTRGAKQTNMTSLRKTLTADGKFIPVQL